MLRGPEGNQNSGVRDWKKSEVIDGFLNSTIRNLHYTFFFNISVKSRIANSDEIALLKFCSLIIK